MQIINTGDAIKTDVVNVRSRAMVEDTACSGPLLGNSAPLEIGGQMVSWALGQHFNYSFESSNPRPNFDDLRLPDRMKGDVILLPLQQKYL